MLQYWRRGAILIGTSGKKIIRQTHGNSYHLYVFKNMLRKQ